MLNIVQVRQQNNIMETLVFILTLTLTLTILKVVFKLSQNVQKTQKSERSWKQMVENSSLVVGMMSNIRFVKECWQNIRRWNIKDVHLFTSHLKLLD